LWVDEDSCVEVDESYTSIKFGVAWVQVMAF
jgi:hypothetical protein